MIKNNLVFKAIFVCEENKFALELTQIPAKEDFVFFENKRFKVVAVEWRLDTVDPIDKGCQGEVIVIMNRH